MNISCCSLNVICSASIKQRFSAQLLMIRMLLRFLIFIVMLAICWVLSILIIGLTIALLYKLIPSAMGPGTEVGKIIFSLLTPLLAIVLAILSTDRIASALFTPDKKY